MDKDDIEKVARGLTVADTENLLAHRPMMEGRRWLAEPASSMKSWNVSGRKMRNLGLIRWATPTGEDTVLTDDGLAVRTYLQEQHQ